MKNKILLILILVQIHTFGQTNDKIISELNENGQLVGQSVITFNEKSEADIYNKSNEWIAYTFRNTESVIQSKIENKMIRIVGISKSIIGPYMGFYFDLSYLIQLDIKENKMRFTASDLTQVAQSSPYTKLSLSFLYKNGELKTGKKFIKVKEQVDNEITLLQNNLTNYIMGNEAQKKDDW